MLPNYFPVGSSLRAPILAQCRDSAAYVLYEKAQNLRVLAWHCERSDDENAERCAAILLAAQDDLIRAVDKLDRLAECCARANATETGTTATGAAE